MSSLNMVAFGTVVSFLVRKDPVLNGQDFLLVKQLVVNKHWGVYLVIVPIYSYNEPTTEYLWY